jgi:hypothetical protein
MKILSNAFSLQMLKNLNANIESTKVDSFPSDCVSAIGHSDTANVLGVETNRINISLNESDELYVAQLMGGRLPEGSTVLPEGFRFEFVKITIKYV